MKTILAAAYLAQSLEGAGVQTEISTQGEISPLVISQIDTTKPQVEDVIGAIIKDSMGRCWDTSGGSMDQVTCPGASNRENQN